MTKQTYEYNHELSQKIAQKIKIEDWYKEQIKQANIEFLKWLESK